MFRITKPLMALAFVSVIAFSGVAHANVQSYVEGGDIYRVKNVTQNIDFTDPVSANACDLLQYKVRIHNPGPTDTLTNVIARVAFGTGASQTNVSIMTVGADNAFPTTTSDTATVNVSSPRTLSYVNGSTQLLDANGNVVSTLPDTVTGNGVAIGNVGVSLGNKRYVQFKMQVSCPAPVTPTPTPTPTPAAPVVTASAPVAATTKALPNTGPGDVLGIFAGASGAGTALHYAVRARRNRD